MDLSYFNWNLDWADFENNFLAWLNWLFIHSLIWPYTAIKMPASTSKKFQPKVQSKEDYEKIKEFQSFWQDLYTLLWSDTVTDNKYFEKQNNVLFTKYKSSSSIPLFFQLTKNPHSPNQCSIKMRRMQNHLQQ